ncbi:MAG: ABC transporter ATP-binding protein [Clostridiales bacterium]|nr:ABC transporter ATP-binding protein [Clostridiales bacterium]
MEEIIRLENVTKKFGGLTAVDNFSGAVETGSIVGLIGPNGAGKTTLFNMMSCTYPPTSGKIFYKGMDVTKARTDSMAIRGLARTFQVTKPFGDMTVVENFMVGAFLHTRDRAVARKQAEEIYEYIGMGCGECKAANETTTVDRKKLEIGRALATKPELLLLDEVMAGCNPQEKLELVETCRKIQKSGVTLLVIEHDIKTIMSLCEKIIILHRGAKLVEGTPSEVANDPRAISAYLGEDYHAGC